VLSGQKRVWFEAKQNINCIKTELAPISENSKLLVNQRGLFWHAIRKE